MQWFKYNQRRPLQTYFAGDGIVRMQNSHIHFIECFEHHIWSFTLTVHRH